MQTMPSTSPTLYKTALCCSVLEGCWCYFWGCFKAEYLLLVRVGIEPICLQDWQARVRKVHDAHHTTALQHTKVERASTT